MKLALAVALAAATLALPPAAASADVYEVTFDVTIDHRFDTRLESANFGTIANAGSAAVALRGRIDDVRFDDEGRLLPSRLGVAPSGPTADVLSATGGSQSTIGDDAPASCTVTGATAVGHPRLLASAGTALRFSPAEALRTTSRCAGDDEPRGRSYTGVDRDGPAALAGPVVARVEPPAPGQASVVREVAATSDFARCPDEAEAGADGPCTMALSGTLTFTRTRTGAAPADPEHATPRAPRLRATGPLDARDNIFIFRVARVDLDARLTARAERPGEWGALDMATSWHERFAERASKRQGGWVSTKGSRKFGSGSFWMRPTHDEFRGTAAYDRGVARDRQHDGEWRHVTGRCEDLRWRRWIEVGGSFAPAGGGRIATTLRLPGLTGAPDTCRAVGIAPQRLRDVRARLTLTHAQVRRKTLVLPFEERRTLRQGALRRDYVVAGSVTLERVDACLNPPEYPCNVRFLTD